MEKEFGKISGQVDVTLHRGNDAPFGPFSPNVVTIGYTEKLGLMMTDRRGRMITPHSPHDSGMVEITIESMLRYILELEGELADLREQVY